MGEKARPKLGPLPAILEALEGSVAEEGGTSRLRVITRHPDRWQNIKPSGWSVDVLWCSPRPGNGRLPYDAQAVIAELVTNETKATAFIVDVLDINGPTTDDVSTWLLSIDDCANMHDVPVFVPVDATIHTEQQVARWATIAPVLSVNATVSTITQEPTLSTTREQVKRETLVESVGHEPTDGLRHLARLPDGFSVDALRRRIMQWRRMGFDVSDLEVALLQDPQEREHCYRRVESDVRRAIDLDRLLTQMQHELHPAHVERDRFRLRQLTGLDAIEQSIVGE